MTGCFVQAVRVLLRSSEFDTVVGSHGRGFPDFLYDDDEFADASGNGFVFKVFDAETDLSLQQPVTDLLDVAMLPAAIGGDATSLDENGEADEYFSRGVRMNFLVLIVGIREQLSEI